MRYRALRRFEQLESRIYLTVTAALSDDGDLLVEGDADGEVMILALDEDTYQVTDGDTQLDPVDGVTDDIRITLEDETPGADDQVVVDLANVAAVDRIVADLGDGDNSLTVRSGTVSGSLRYVGGDGNDRVTIADDLIVERSIVALLGDGDNDLVIEGEVDRNVLVYAGDGDDTVDVGGSIDDGLEVVAAEGDDLVTIQPSAAVGRSVFAHLGDGDNALSQQGTIDGSLVYRGGEGNDEVDIAAGSTVEGDVKLQLGDGDNAVTQAGAIGGDLVVRSANEDDAVTYDPDKIGGEADVQPGVEREAGPRRFPFFAGRRFRRGFRL